jgi:hypothetical protein
MEVAWTLTNVASGTNEQTEALVQKDGIRTFQRLLLSPHQDVSEQAVWGIGNMSGSTPEIRDQILDQDEIL